MSFRKAVIKVEGLLSTELNKRLNQGYAIKEAWELTLKYAHRHIQTHPKDRFVWNTALNVASDKLAKLLKKLKDEQEKKAESEAQNVEQHAP